MVRVLPTKFWSRVWNSFSIFFLLYFILSIYKDPKNYKVISAMSFLGKLFCAMVNQRLYAHAWIKKNGKIWTWQEGFQRRMGCNLQCFAFYQLLFINLQNKMYTTIRFKVECLDVLLTSKSHMIQWTTKSFGKN